MNICFLSNYTKTYLFDAVAADLVKRGFKTYWIAVNQKLNDFLVEKHGSDRVLLINRTNVGKEEEPVDDFKINELIYGDRVLRHDATSGAKFLTNIQRPIYDFLKKNDIELVMGEITWAHEILTFRICEKRKELNCTFLNPHVIRIPDSRFAFFTDERQSKILEIGKSVEIAAALEAKKPDYLAINDKKVKKAASFAGRIDKVKRFITDENMEANDPTLLTNTRKRLEVRTREEWNKETYKSVERVPFDTEKFGDYVFLGLHKQPEASVDVFGRYYEDQFQNIMNLWRALPQGWNLLIKEHTNAIGDRAKDFYEKIQSLPGVFLIDEKTNSYPVIENARLVVTVTGTIGYEAGLMRIPAATFAPCFFNGLSTCRQISLEDLANSDLKKIAEDLAAQPDNRLEISKFLMSNSFVGKFYDPITSATVLEAENVRNISQAIEEVAGVLVQKNVIA